MSDRRNELVLVPDLMLIIDRPKALGVTTDVRPYKDTEFAAKGKPKPVEVWIAKSLMGENKLKNRGDIGSVEVPRWLAEEHELFYTE